MRTEKLKLIIYCRISDVKQQVRGSGLDSQETSGREYAKRRGNELGLVFSDVMSGEHACRPKMIEAIAYLRKHKGTVLIIDHATSSATSASARCWSSRSMQATLRFQAGAWPCGLRSTNLSSPSRLSNELRIVSTARATRRVRRISTRISRSVGSSCATTATRPSPAAGRQARTSVTHTISARKRI